MNASVLVVDDDELVQDMVSIVMSRQRHVTTVATSFQQALAVLGRQFFDLVIADIYLGDGSGMELLKEIQRKYKDTYVILITGDPDMETVRTALREGAFDYLVKPILPVELIHVTQRALEHRCLVVERQMLGNRLNAIFRGVDDAIVVLDEAWCIRQINEAASRILGLEASSPPRPLRDEANWLFQVVEPLLRQARDRGAGKRAVSMVTRNHHGLSQILSCTASLFEDPMRGAPGTILVVRDENQLAMLAQEKAMSQGWHGLVGASLPMQQLYELLEQLAQVDSSVLILGETGTGKEMVARALHAASPRCQHPFVAVNCAALPASLLESELFGHVKGAFTGALRDKTGRFKWADGGTLFLDEIGDLAADIQVKLLRVVQEQTFEAVGDTTPIKVNVRLVAATHRNLRERVQEKLFREDFYYRLKVVEARIPPLRERRSDLPLLIDHFLARFNARMKRSIKGVDDAVLTAFMEYPWPGNVRELEHVLEHAMVVARQPVLQWSNLPPDLRLSPPHRLQQKRSTTGGRGRPLAGGLPAGEGPDQETILQTLHECQGQITMAANRLGISRTTLWRRMKTMGPHEGDEGSGLPLSPVSVAGSG